MDVHSKKYEATICPELKVITLNLKFISENFT